MLKLRPLYIAILSVGTLTTGCHTFRSAPSLPPATSSTAPAPGADVAREKEFGKFDAASRSASGKAGHLMAEARTWIGTPYKYGGADRTGVDCSGLVLEVYKKALGISLPRNSKEQSVYCVPIERENLQPGDLLFFASNRKDEEVNHVGMYVGENMMIHASSSMGVIVSDLASPYYARTFKSAGAVERWSNLPESEPTPVTNVENNAPQPDVLPPTVPVADAPMEKPVNEPKKDEPQMMHHPVKGTPSATSTPGSVADSRAAVLNALKEKDLSK